MMIPDTHKLVTNTLWLESKVLRKKGAVCFAVSGKAEEVYFYTFRIEHRATDTQVPLNSK